VVFIVVIEAEKLTCIQKGLTIARILVKVKAVRAFTVTT